MNKLNILLIFTIFIVGCGSEKEKTIDEILTSDDLIEIRKKKSEIVSQQLVFRDQIKKLDEKIALLDTNKKIPLITSLVIKDTVFNHYVELQGNVSTKKMSVLMSEYPGTLKSVFVKEGQRVSKGTTLAKIDDGNLAPQLAQLKLQEDLAKTTYERQGRLWEQKIGSEMQYLQAKTNYEAQNKVVKQMQEQIEKTIIKAPFSGFIDEIITEEGNMVSPGVSQIIRIVNLAEMHIETDVPERHLSSVTKGKTVQVELPVLGETINTKVSQVGSYINPANRTFKIEVLLANKNNTIKPNLTAKLKINDYTSEKAILIPQSIISENSMGEEYVYVIKNKKGQLGTAEKVIIETGKSEGDYIEILNGIDNGVEVILEGARSVKAGQEVKVVNQKRI